MNKIMTNEYADRLQHWMRTLQQDFYEPLGEIAFEGFLTFEDLTPEEAAARPFTPVSPGMDWGHTWEYMWLRAKIVLPQQAKGQQIVMELNPGGEAALFVNGEPFGTRRAEWVSVPHHYMVDNFLTLSGEAGETFDLLAEVYAGHHFPDAGGCSTGPVLPGSYGDPKQEGRRARLGVSTFGVWREDAYQLYMDVSTLKQLYDQLPEEDMRTAQLADALENFTHLVDFEQSAQGRLADYRRAREALRPCLEAKNGSCQAQMYAVGNAHLDLAWLWPLGETRRKTARTFAQQLRLMDRYPEYRYLQSQPAAYEMCRTHYPSLYRRIQEAAARGQWIAEGAMYVEPDTNMACGEALIRQLLYGKRFFKEEFGVNARVLWLPDTFGYTAALPQILKGCGVDYLVTQKIFWSYNDADRFPYHYFTWRGMDGSEVVSFLPTSYTYRTDPEEIVKTWASRVQKRNLDSFLIPFGYGDGGGGPCRDHIEYARREGDLQGMPRVEMTDPLTFFETQQSKGGPKHTWDGELYFSAHRGTYTTQALVKKNNRVNELMLRQAELFSALAMRLKDAAPDQQKLTALWKTLLLNQFHDILPGSSIARVYEEANAAHDALRHDALALADASLAALVKGEGVTLFNPLSRERDAVVALDDRFARGARTMEGEEIPVLDGLARVRIPAMGSVSLMPAALAPARAACRAELTQDGFVLENDRIRAAFNAAGEMTDYLLKDTALHITGRRMNRMRLYKDVPRLFDAWDIDSCYTRDEVPAARNVQLRILRAEGLRAEAEISMEIGESRLVQRVFIEAGSEQVFFDTTVLWQELHRLLKVEFDGGVMARNALHEMQFGYVERPAHRSNAYDQTRFEVCNHHYTALCDQGCGFAVLNDCKYGVSALEGVISLTLLRAAASPEMRSDQGTHTFTYAFTAWTGAFLDAPVVHQGYALNQPVYLAQGSAPRMSAFTLSDDHVILETVKPAEDGSGDLILRLYESKRTSARCSLTCSLPFKEALVCDMLENPVAPCASEGGVIALSLRPFEILTLRLTAHTP